jgi:hypothetical protein
MIVEDNSLILNQINRFTPVLIIEVYNNQVESFMPIDDTAQH